MKEEVAVLIVLPVLSFVLVILQNIATVRASEDFWTTNVPMPLAGSGFKAATVNEQYTLIGYIPEFPSWKAMLLVLTTLVVALAVYRLRITKT